MDDTPITKRPWFYIASWIGILLIAYFWQIFRMGGIRASLFDIFFDLACLFPILLFFWISFFAQFVLPVKTRDDRKKVISGLFTDLFGGHGPALFIENGDIKEHSGERLKKGPGVIWLDSASAAVTRTAVKIKQVLGPGVHFIDSGEYIASTVDLHVQTQTLGLREGDDPFGEHGENDEELDEDVESAIDRKKMVAAITRDGIEVIPNITIRFRVDTGFPRDGEPGSRFGYRIGFSKRSRENEDLDKDAIKRAVLGESVNPNMVSDSTRRRVAWNELPASLAVDLWREYAAKFTLDDLFNPVKLAPDIPASAPQPSDDEIDPLSQPVLITSRQTSSQDQMAILLRKVNMWLNNMVQWFEKAQAIKDTSQTSVYEQIKSTSPTKSAPAPITGLQVINTMVNERLKKLEVPVINDHGDPDLGIMESPEYRILKDRGIAVLSVNINNPKIDPVIEASIINGWSAAWLDNAKAESRQIERRQNIVKSRGQDIAIRQYATLLCEDLIRKKPYGVKDTLKTLVMRTRTLIINNDQLRKDMTEESQVLEDILRWTEADE